METKNQSENTERPLLDMQNLLAEKFTNGEGVLQLGKKVSTIVTLFEASTKTLQWTTIYPGVAARLKYVGGREHQSARSRGAIIDADDD